jgi:hypothetical protein
MKSLLNAFHHFIAPIQHFFFEQQKHVIQTTPQTWQNMKSSIRAICLLPASQYVASILKYFVNIHEIADELFPIKNLHVPW